MIRSEINDLARQFELFQTLSLIEFSNPQFDSLNTRLSEAIRRESELLTRREQLAVDASLLGSGFVVESRALDAEPTGRSAMLGALAGLILGATIGVAVAYWRSSNRRQFENKREPEKTLKAPLLAQISGPARGDDAESSLPSIADPGSVEGDAYRTLVDAMLRSMDLSRSDATSTSETPARRGIILAVISARDGGGRAAVTVNAAVEAARSRLRVLLIDGDADGRRVSRLLFVASSNDYFTSTLPADPVRSGEPAPIRVLELGDGTRLDAMEQKLQRRSAQEVSDPAATSSALHKLADRYDLIIIDEPPLLDHATSGRAIVHADRALIVVSQGSDIGDADDVRYRLEVLGVDPIGYVYRTGRRERRFAVPESESDDGDSGTPV